MDIVITANTDQYYLTNLNNFDVYIQVPFNVDSRL